MENIARAISGRSSYESWVGFAGLAFLFAGLSWWMPSKLGFYSDDWIFLSNTIYLPADLAAYLKVNWYARPIYALIAWALNLIANGAPAYWQVISSGTVLASAVIAAKIIAAMSMHMGCGERASSIGGVCGAAVLLFSPWMLATFAWPTGVLTLWGFILFGIGYLFIGKGGLGSKWLGSIFVLCGFLSYEAYWFTFVPLLLITKSFRGSRLSSIIRASFWYLVPLGAAVIYQRAIVPHFVPGHSKAISANLSLVLNNITRFDEFVAAAIAPVSVRFLLLIISALIVTLLVIKAVSFRRVVLVVAALVLGMIITAVIYGAAGYGLSGTGVMSRTMAAPGFYFSVLIGMLAAASVEQFRREPRSLHVWSLVLSIFGVLFALLIVGLVARVSEWVSIHDQSKRVLESLTSVVDRDYLRESANDVSVVVQIDGDPNGEVFGAYWELSGAVAHADPSLVPTTNISFLPARQGVWNTVWDGKSVIQGVCSAPEGNVVESRESGKPPLYYRIDPRDGRVLESGRLIKGKSFGCNDSKPVFESPGESPQ